MIANITWHILISGSTLRGLRFRHSEGSSREPRNRIELAVRMEIVMWSTPIDSVCARYTRLFQQSLLVMGIVHGNIDRFESHRDGHISSKSSRPMSSRVLDFSSKQTNTEQTRLALSRAYWLNLEFFPDAVSGSRWDTRFFYRVAWSSVLRLMARIALNLWCLKAVSLAFYGRFHNSIGYIAGGADYW